MSDAPTANPLGAGSDIITATEKISHLLNPEPQGQPEPGEDAQGVVATDPANQQPSEPVYDESTGRYRDPKTNKFVAAPEQETGDGDPSQEESANVSEEGADVDLEADQPEEPGEDTEYEELSDTVDGLAEQLGIDADELASSLKARVKINGEESEVTLSELVKGYQMEGDYRLKTAEVSEQRRAIQDAEAEISKQREQFTSKLGPMLEQLEQLVSVDENYLNQLAAEGRSDEYLQYKHAADMRKAEFQRAQEAKQAIEQEKQQEQEKAHRNAVAENNRLLETLKPEWAKDPDKGRKEIAEVRQYMKSEGFDPSLVDNLFDARVIAMADNARKYHALSKTRPEKLNTLKAVPKKVMRPGPSKPKVDPKVKARAENLNRLRQTGKVDDAAKVIAGMI